MSSNNGVISVPIDISDSYIAMVVRPKGDWDVGEPIYQLGAINKWSFYKPVISDKHSELTSLEDFYNTNNGFSIQSYNHPVSAIRSMTDGLDNWSYERPKNDIDWARLTDWNGYNHFAANWFNLSMNKSSASSGTQITIKLNRSDFLLTEFLQFSAMSAYKNAISSQPSNKILSWGLIFWKNGANDAVYYKYGDNVNVPTDTENDFEFTVPSTVLDPGTYYVMPTVTSYTNLSNNTFTKISKDDISYLWWAFPSDSNSTRTFTVNTVNVLNGIQIEVIPYDNNYVSGGTYFAYGIGLTLINTNSVATGNLNVRMEIVNYDGGTIVPSDYGTTLINTTANIPASTGGSYGYFDTDVDFEKTEAGYLRWDFWNSTDVPQVMVTISNSTGEKQLTFDALTGALM